MPTSAITGLHVEHIKKLLEETPGDAAESGEQWQYRGGGAQPRRHQVSRLDYRPKLPTPFSLLLLADGPLLAFPAHFKLTIPNSSFITHREKRGNT